MDRHLSLQTYVPRPLADWIKGKARDQQVSVSIVIRDQLVEAWQRENEARKRPAALDPVSGPSFSISPGPSSRRSTIRNATSF